MLIAIVAGLLMPPFLIIKNRARAPFSCRGGGMVGTHTASQPASRFSDYSQPQTFRRKTEQSLPSSYFFFVGNHPSFHRRSITDCTTLLFILASSNSFPSNSLAPSIRKRIFSPRRGTQFLSSSSYSSSFLYTHTRTNSYFSRSLHWTCWFQTWAWGWWSSCQSI